MVEVEVAVAEVAVARQEWSVARAVAGQLALHRIGRPVRRQLRRP